MCTLQFFWYQFHPKQRLTLYNTFERNRPEGAFPLSGSSVVRHHVHPQLLRPADEADAERTRGGLHQLHRVRTEGTPGVRWRRGAPLVVRLQVRTEGAPLGEAVDAERAAEGPLARVHAQVALEVALVGEGARAEAALEGALARVRALVHDQAALVRRREGALAALEPPPWIHPCARCTTRQAGAPFKRHCQLTAAWCARVRAEIASYS